MSYDQFVDEKRLDAFVQLIQTIEENLPEGFEKVEEYGGVSYVVPHTTYPAGYHVTPEKPLPFLSAVRFNWRAHAKMTPTQWIELYTETINT